MTKKHILTRPAGSALVVALALLGPPAFAQDAAPTQPSIVLPTVPAEPVTDSAAPAAPAPVTVNPTPTLQIEVPEVAAEEEAPAAASVNATRTQSAPAATAPTAPTRQPASQPEPQPTMATEMAASASDDLATDLAGGGDATMGMADAAPVASPAAEVSNDAAADDGTLIMVGGAAAAGLGLLGLFMAGFARRRRKSGHGAAVEHTPVFRRTARPDHKAAAAPLAAAPVAATDTNAPTPTPTTTPIYGGGKWDDAGYVNASPVVGAGNAEKLAQTPEGRTALLDRLTRARPDAANPFHSPRARRRRARLIVQTLTQRMREQPGLDFGRFYRSFGRKPLATV